MQLLFRTDFAKSLEQKLLAEFYTKKEEMEGAQYIINTKIKEEAPCITDTKKRGDVQCIVIKEETEESEYIIDDDLGTNWKNSEDTVQIEVVPDIFQYR